MSKAEEQDDTELLERLRDRSSDVRRAAEREVFERFREPVQRVMHRLLGRDVDDCAQETLVDVFRGLAGFEGRAKLETWVYRVALRRGWKCLAERGRRGELVEEREASEDGIEALAAREEGVLDGLEGAELAERFRKALARLDLDQRTVLSLTAVEGMGPPEIAEVLGVPVGTVHSRLSRARERVRGWLGVES